MTLATPSELGLFVEEAVILSVGRTMLLIA
jgi:hypothetical protein